MTPEQTFVPEPFLERLRSETRPDHHALESVMDLLREDLTLGHYRYWVEKLYGVFAPLEDRIVSRWGLDAFGLDLAERRRAPLLVADLKALGVADPMRIPVCQDLPALTGDPEAFGCLYVLEGSALGGHVVSRHVLHTLGLTPETGGAFFNGHGDRTGTMWRTFRSALADYAVTPEIQGRVIAAARATFRSFRSWCGAGKNA